MYLEFAYPVVEIVRLALKKQRVLNVLMDIIFKIMIVSRVWIFVSNAHKMMIVKFVKMVISMILR